MSVESTRTAPQVETLLTIWQDTLNEATLTVDQALAAAAMMLGFVVMNTAPDPRAGHALIDDIVEDIHGFVEGNWHQAAAMRRAAGIRPINWHGAEDPLLPGISVSEMKKMIEQSSSINPVMPPPPKENRISEPWTKEPDVHLRLTAQEFEILEMLLEDMPYREVYCLMDLIKAQVKA